MSSGIYNKEISDYITGLKEKKEKIKLDDAVNFNSFELKDQQAILWIYQTKAVQGELKADIKDKIKGIEETAIAYRAQKCAFQDVLTEQGFEPTQEVPSSYGGKIAMLTEHGTFIVLGKSKRRGRFISMSRIHSPKYNHDKNRGYLRADLKLDESPYISMVRDGGYVGSPIIALAVNPKGSDDDEIEEKNIHNTVIMMGLKTAHFLINPKKIEEIIEKEIEEVPSEEIEEVKIK